MGLGDIYNNAPDSFAGQANRQTGQAFQSLPGLQQSKLQAQGMEQANQDAAYNSPARQANPHEQDIGSYYRKLVGMDDPNVPPEFIERFHAERRAPSLGQSSGQSQYNGPMNTQGAPEPMSLSASQGGYGLSATQPEQRIQGGLSSSPRMSQPVSQGISQAQGQRPPMTQGDVNRYSQLGQNVIRHPARPVADSVDPFEIIKAKGDEVRKTETLKGGIKGGLQTQGEGAKKENLAKMEKRKWQEAIWQHEDRLASIEGRVRTGELSHSQASMELKKYLGEIATLGKLRSSLPELSDDAEAGALAEELEKRAKQSLIRLEQNKSQPQPSTSKTSSTSVKVQAPQGNVNKDREDALKWIADPKNANHPALQSNKKKYGVK